MSRGPTAKRDLAESNARDLEYQKGTLSDQLRTVPVQLRDTSEQPRGIFEQKKGIPNW